MSFVSGFLLFPGLTQLDLTGPYEVLARLPGARVELIWKTLEPVRSEHGMLITPTCTFEDCPPLDLFCIPGGAGVNDLMLDEETIAFIQRQSTTVDYLTSVCTGSLLLGAAGLLKGKKATTHWLSHEFLADLQAHPVNERVVRDGNLFTAGGVTSGIDFALSIVAEAFSQEMAEKIQLMIEYDPAPPFDAGSPNSASSEITTSVRAERQAGQQKRKSLINRIKPSL